MSARADCPACGRSGLHITYKADGGIAIYCHGSSGECSVEDIIGVHAIPMVALAPDAHPASKLTRPVDPAAKARAEAVTGDLIVLRPSFVQMTGYLPAALMLQQILYWEARPGGVFKQGFWWIAKSYDEWAEELGISPHEAEEARTKLEELALIHTAIWLFGSRRVLHYRLDQLEFDKLYSHYRPEPVRSGR